VGRRATENGGGIKTTLPVLAFVPYAVISAFCLPFLSFALLRLSSGAHHDRRLSAYFTPRELIKKDPGQGRIVHFDENGAPSYTIHSLLYDLDEHIRMMDLAGIDAALLTSAAGMCADLDKSRFINDKAKRAERDYPGRFIGAAHVHPLGGGDALRELARCAEVLGFQGVVITSETDGLYLDAKEFEPFWAEAARLDLFVFVQPALKLNESKQFDGYDTARSVGREFSLVMATIRLINSGVFDRHPNLMLHMAHLGGGLAALLGRVRPYQDKEFWGPWVIRATAPSPRTTSITTCGTISSSTRRVFAARSARSRSLWWKFRQAESSSPPITRRKSARARRYATSSTIFPRSAPTASRFWRAMCLCF
jgi:predicted TIM-barrel fold metal-dependent hydrolase